MSAIPSMWRKKNNDKGKNSAPYDDDDDDSIPPPPPPIPPPQDHSPASTSHNTNHHDDNYSRSQYTDDYTDDDGSATNRSREPTVVVPPLPPVDAQRTVSGTNKQYSVKKPYETLIANQTFEEEEAGMDDIEVHNSPVVKRLNAHERKRRLQKFCIILVVIVVIILVVALGAGIGTGNSSGTGTPSGANSGGTNTGGGGGGGNGTNPGGNSTPNSLSFFISSLGVSDTKALADTSSPQYAALSWLKNNIANSQYKFDTDAITSNSTLQLIAKQRYAIATMYYSLQGKSWTNTSGWMSSSDVCSWIGVYCGANSSSTTVQGFILDGQNLNGTLPQEIQIFDALTYISLYYNNLAGSIPSGLFSLKNLRYLDLTSNNLAGQISSKIGQLSNMQYLYLGSNRFTGVIPTSLGLLTGLVQLWLDSNNFNSSVATIPTQLGQLTNLASLRMQNMGGFSGGGVGGKIPSEFGNLQLLGAYPRWIFQ